MNKSYMKWLLDSHKNAGIFLLIIEVILGFLPFVTDGFHHPGSATYNTSIAMITIASLAAAVILPVLFFSYVHKKNSVDLYFSLPVSRKEQLITTIVFLLIAICGSFLISTLLVWIFAQNGHSTFGQWIAMQPWMLYGALVVMLFTTCVDLLANNLFDGFVMVCAYAALPMVISMTFDSFITSMVAGHPYSVSSDFWEYFSPIWMTGHNIAGIATISQYSFRPSFLFVLALYLILSLHGLNRNFIHRKSERAEQTSDSFLTYPFIGNAYLFLLLSSSVFSSFGAAADSTDVIFYFLLFLCYIVAAFVWHRSMEFHWKYLLGYAISLAISFVIAYGGWQTHGFGLAEHYPMFTGKYQIYEYSINCDPDDLGKMDDTSDISVNATIEIPDNEKEQDQKVIDLMEDIRKKEISRYYESADSIETAGNLNVYNTNRSIHHKNVESFNEWTYSLTTVLTENQLKQLTKYGKVEVYDDHNGKTVSLSKYLAERKR